MTRTSFPVLFCCLPFFSERTIPLYLLTEHALRGHSSLGSVSEKCSQTVLAKAPSGFHLWKNDFDVLLRKKRDVKKWNENNDTRMMKIRHRRPD